MHTDPRGECELEACPSKRRRLPPLTGLPAFIWGFYFVFFFNKRVPAPRVTPLPSLRFSDDAPHGLPSVSLASGGCGWSPDAPSAGQCRASWALRRWPAEAGVPFLEWAFLRENFPTVAVSWASEGPGVTAPSLRGSHGRGRSHHTAFANDTPGPTEEHSPGTGQLTRPNTLAPRPLHTHMCTRVHTHWAAD